MKERAVFLDKLRVAATCAVVLLHTVTGVMDHTDMEAYPLEKTVFLVLLDLICWCVPVFLLISGYLFLNPDRKITMGKMLGRYCRRIALALLVFGVPYACLEQIATERCFRWRMIGNSFLMVVRGESWSHLWYLYLILFLYLLTPGLKKLLEVLPRPILYILLTALFIGSSVLPYLVKLLDLKAVWVLPDWVIYLFYYISGFLFWDGFRSTGSQEGKSVEEIPVACDQFKGIKPENSIQEKTETNKKGRKRKAWSGGYLAAALAFAMVCSRLSGSYTLQMAYNYPFTAVLSLLLFQWGSSMHGKDSSKHRKMENFWKQAALLSFTVYLVHPVFLNTAYKFFHVTPLSFPIGISLPVFFGIVLLLSVVVAWVLYRIPFLRKYVL